MINVQGITFHGNSREFKSISVENAHCKRTISRNNNGVLYYTKGFSEARGTEYRSISPEEAKDILFKMITEMKDGDSVKIDYKG